MGPILVISPSFLKDLDTCRKSAYLSGQNEYRPDNEDLEDNYRAFYRCLRNTKQQLLFNCSKKELVEKGKESPFLGWMIQAETESSDKRLLASENTDAMAFLKTEEAPTEEQKNRVYLDSISKEGLKRAKQFGILALNPEDILKESSLYSNIGFEIEKGKPSELRFVGFRKICNTITIKDLYVLTRDSDYNIYKVLHSFIPINKTEDYSIIIYTGSDKKIGSKEEEEYFLSKWHEIKEWLIENRKYPISLTLISATKDDFHDRHFLTNYHYCLSPAGLDIIDNRNITRNRIDGGYSSSRSTDIFTPVGAQTTPIYLYYPVFARSYNEGVMSDYVAQIKELQKLDFKYRVTVDENGFRRGGQKVKNRLFSIVSE